MAITGIRRLTYLVDDLAECTSFFEDFGLSLRDRRTNESVFELPNGSEVRLLPRGHADLPFGTAQTGVGVHECTWAVDSQDSLGALVRVT